MKERLQKILARAGVASRRAAEELIVAGRVRVNGRIVTELGVTADPRHDRVDVDGKRIVREPLVYLLFHKPRGMVATMKDPEGRPAIGDLVAKIGVRVVPVGRLDFHTSGALLLTNDGELIDALLHPRREVPKVYIAKMRGSIDVKELGLLRNGVVLDDGEKTRPAEAFVHREEGGHSWVEITLFEGKNRQIHRMGDAIGHPVLRLARLSFAGIGTEGLRPGQWRPLDARELERLVRDWVTPRRQSDEDERGATRVDAAPERGRQGGRPAKPQPRAPRAMGAASSQGPEAGASREPTRGPRPGSPRGPSAGPARGPGRGPSSPPFRGPPSSDRGSRSEGERPTGRSARGTVDARGRARPGADSRGGSRTERSGERSRDERAERAPRVDRSTRRR